MSPHLAKLRRLIFGCLPLAAVVFANGQQTAPPAGAKDEPFETRCGWFSNPTPANIWLYDKDGDWTIGVQGGYQVEGEWEAPDFKPRQWVKTNVGEYGYGCACFELKVNGKTREVLEIKSSRALPLSTCRKDHALKRWRHLFK
ncbi:MAG: DUF4087 domain-containing protein [Acidobacteria bacterium]|nr:DUF4087 domain-containing protein [Acidobacteriota bacterium]